MTDRCRCDPYTGFICSECRERTTRRRIEEELARLRTIEAQERQAMREEIARMTAERDATRNERDKAREGAWASAHLIVEAGVVPGISPSTCRCNECRHVALGMADAGYLDRIRDRWWESNAGKPAAEEAAGGEE